VQISRVVVSTLKARARSETDEARRAILGEGRWLVLHIIFIKTGMRFGAGIDLTSEDKQRLSVAIDRVAEDLVTACKAMSWKKQYRSVVEAVGDVQAIKAAVMARLPQTL